MSTWEKVRKNRLLFVYYTAYALDHTVHHLAIVRIGLSEETDKVEVDSNFGVAPSTIRYRKKCVA